MKSESCKYHPSVRRATVYVLEEPHKVTLYIWWVPTVTFTLKVFSEPGIHTYLNAPSIVGSDKEWEKHNTLCLSVLIADYPVKNQTLLQWCDYLH